MNTGQDLPGDDSAQALADEHSEEAQRYVEGELPKLERRFAAGEKEVVLRGLALCMLVRIIPPEWLRREFVNVYFDVAYHAKFKSWDDAFGEPWKGRHLNSVQKETAKRPYIWHRVRQLHDQEGRAIDDGLFDQVAKEFSCGTRQAKEAYKDLERKLPPQMKLVRRRKMARKR